VDFSDLDLQSAAMIGGFFVAGFVAVWVFLTLRQGERQKQSRNEDDRGG
jgi:hypothetical protein